MNASQEIENTLCTSTNLISDRLKYLRLANQKRKGRKRGWNKNKNNKEEKKKKKVPSRNRT